MSGPRAFTMAVFAVLLAGCWIVAGTPEFTDQDGEPASITGPGATSGPGGTGGVESASSSGGAGGAAGGQGGSAAGGAGGTMPIRVVFVTDGSWASGSQLFSSAEDGNALCNNEAMTAGLSGHFVAWLSTSSSNAIDKLGAGRWFLPTGALVFESKEAITTTGPMAAIDRNATGEKITSGSVWTGTGAGGKATTLTCGDWAEQTGWGTIGQLTNTAPDWTNDGNIMAGCAGARRLYCFEN